MSGEFSTSPHGKWILAGEHTVMRGGSAIVCPLPLVRLNLSYQFHPVEYAVDFSVAGKDWQTIITQLLVQGMELAGVSTAQLTGRFQIRNEIPLSVGLGGSAALCVALARWFVWRGFILPEACDEFARQLENRFHHDSSGIDIAGVSYLKPLLYTRGQPPIVLAAQWQPIFTLSYSGQVGATAEAVTRVARLAEKHAELALSIDRDMSRSLSLACQGLEQTAETGLADLTEAINLAKSCFERWGLIEKPLQEHMDTLKQQGALACKPTGSGIGGYVVSLWKEPPVLHLLTPYWQV